MAILGYLFAAYLVGSISSAWLLVKLRTGQDLRHGGTGNLGARNAGRHIGIWALAVFLFDFTKGYLVVWWGQAAFGQTIVLFGALAVTLGHIFSLFLRLSGGKGLATGAGVIAAISPAALLIVACGGLLVLAATRKFYGAALCLLVLVIPVLWVYLPSPGRWWFPFAFSLVGLYTHRAHLRTPWRQLR